MARYRYIAISTQGVRVEGVLGAASEQAVLAELDAKRLTPVKVERARERAAWRGRLSVRHQADAYGQMADLLHAGVPLLRALKLLGGLKSRPGVARAFGKLAEAVERGSDLAAAMEEQGTTVFPQVHVAMIRAGERGGFLDEVAQRLGALVSGQADLRTKVVGNLVYPGVLAVVGVAVGTFIFAVMVPGFREQIARTGGEAGLPLVTRVVFGVSEAFGRFWPVTAAVLAMAAVGGFFAARDERARAWADRMLPRLPVVGGVVKALVAARVCGLLGSMLGNGVPLLAALAIAREGAGNRVMAAALGEAMERVRAGQGLAEPLARCGLLEADVVEMIAVGEGANNLDEVLERIARTMEARVERRLSVAVKLIEPALLALVAAVVLVVAIALLLPMAQMGGRL